MTCYQGGKKRIGKRIYTVINIIDKELNPNSHLPYFEPFVGMGSIIRHFHKQPERKLYASDINEDLIAMWEAVQEGWIPPVSVTRERFNELKEQKTVSAERCFVGCVASFGGNYFHSYRLHLAKNGIDYMKMGGRCIEKIRPEINKVNFMKSESYDKSYEKIKGKKIIYCDPPYAGNDLSNKLFSEFDYDKFWDTMRRWSKHNLVIISESTAPLDFEKIWSNQSYVRSDTKTKKYPDYLFVHEDTYKKLSKKLLSQIEHS